MTNSIVISLSAVVIIFENDLHTLSHAGTYICGY